MADIFVSYTKSDRDWAFWLAAELKELGHTPHIHEWEIKGGDDIYAWMEAHHDAADRVLCVVSDDYLKAPYSTLERNAALWQAASKRPGFVLLVVVKQCRLPTLSDHIRRCELFGIPEEAARQRFRTFMQTRGAPEIVRFPGKVVAVSNIPIRVPTHFMGREEALAAIETGLGRYDGRVAITALHGLRGVGKTVLAAAYAELHRGDYRATSWIRAQSEPTMRADLVALGVRLGWVPPDEKEEPALTAVMERLRHEGEGVLLIFDNATDADALMPYLPRGGSARVLVTSNAPNWRGIAERVEIQVWPKEIGADYLIARTGGESEREAAEDLSETLGGLPLAHEQAAAYCERLEIPLVEYRRRFAAAPVQMLDARRDAPAEYHEKLTVAKTLALAIEEAANLHPAAEPLIVYSALLAPEPIPLFLFAEAREKLGEPLASVLAGDGLDEAVATLRAFALVDRETIVDERDPTVATDAIRLHRLVREIAGARCLDEAREQARRVLTEALAAIYPQTVLNDPKAWPRGRRLDGFALALVGSDSGLPKGAEMPASYLLNQLAAYRFKAVGDYGEARPLYQRSLAIIERVLGCDHPDTVVSLNNFADVLQAQGDLAAARLLYERALAINETARGPEHPFTATSVNNLGALLWVQGDFVAAQPLFERALEFRRKMLGVEHPDTATSMNNLASLLWAQGNLDAARPLLDGALAIREKLLGPEHPDTAGSLNNLAGVLREQGELTAAQQLAERALAIREKVLGPDHPGTAQSLNTLGLVLLDQGARALARSHFEHALAIREKILGPEHPDTAASLNNLGSFLRASGDLREARPLLRRALAIREKTLGPEHPDTATSLNSFARLLQDEGDLAEAQPLLERALGVWEKRFGPEHTNTGMGLNNLARLLQERDNFAAARPLYERALAIYEKGLGPQHPDTVTVRKNLAALLGRDS